MQRAVANRLALDGMARDQVEHDGRRVAQRLQQAGAVVRAEALGQCVGHHPHPGVDQPDIAPRGAEADVGGLEHRHGRAALGRVQRGGQPGEAGADHGDVHRDAAGQRRRGRRGGRRGRPQAVGQGIGWHRTILARSGAQRPNSPRR